MRVRTRQLALVILTRAETLSNPPAPQHISEYIFSLATHHLHAQVGSRTLSSIYYYQANKIMQQNDRWIKRKGIMS